MDYHFVEEKKTPLKSLNFKTFSTKMKKKQFENVWSLLTNKHISCRLLRDECLHASNPLKCEYSMLRNSDHRWQSINDANTIFSYRKSIFTISESNVKRLSMFH